jgi:hypothetical protein
MNRDRHAGPQRGSAGERALWTFLLYMLVGPFAAGIIGFVVVALGGPGGPLSAVGAQLALPAAALAGPAAVQTFLWAGLAAALAGAGLAALVALRGTFGWLEAAVAGVLAAGAAVVVTGAAAGGGLTGLAFAAGLIAIACRAVLVRAGVLGD